MSRYRTDRGCQRCVAQEFETTKELTNEVGESCAKLNLGLNKGVSVAFKCSQKDLFHLHRESPQVRQRGLWDGRQHLRTQELEDLLDLQIRNSQNLKNEESAPRTSYRIASAFAIRPAMDGA